ncbi:uncharacterized protein LOC117117711 [Anneissia japonica]|uniref:uncharacterized protein LOC117117711 n=1 Tax=Anneissia japonica TaxID=1529436 RepID=UPI0014256880|nr:uncharacterized protein LOC117117711 [Anneissia japonica]
MIILVYPGTRGTCQVVPDRSTILHFLAEYSYVSVLRRALEKTNRHVNRTDIFGRTPLHICLLGPRSYEEQREKTLCLMTYGASVTITDESGKTPLDSYDDNKCTKYEESTRSFRKKELRKLIEELSVPSEILARGHDAVMAFKDAIKYGEITVVNSRMMFLGNEGSGKTSCINAMLGKGFNKNEPSTDGIVTTTVFQTVDEDCSKWEEQTDVDECERAKQVHEHAIAATVAKKLTESHQTKQVLRENITTGVANKLTDSQQMTSTSKSLPASSSSSEHRGAFGWFYRLFKEKPKVSPSTQAVSTYRPIRSHVNINRIPDEIHKKLVGKLDDQSHGNSRNVGPSDVTCIWDYAGHLTYYITHRFFLTDGSAYGVVFSLVDNLDALAKPRDPQKGPFEMTNLEVIIFWIRSIYEHAVLLHGTDKKIVINGIIASPTISLIGTHKDLLPGSDVEKQASINGIFDRIFKEINGEPYEVHVDLERYAVDNTAELDGDIERLKTNVGGYMKAMARTVPIKWVDFQTKIQEAGKNTLRMSFDKMAKIAFQCGINKENFIHVLIYLNDIGIILYSPNNKKLQNTVITNIHMLIGIFMKIITVVKPDDVDKVAPLMMKYWRKLDEEGILAEQLVRHLWRNELTASKEDGDGIFEDFIELMKTFGLLFEKRSQESDRVFIVPSRMNITTDNLEVKEDEVQTASIYVTPKTFLPDAVYSVLVVKFLDLSQDKAFNSNPELFANQAKIGFDNMHYLRLGVVYINDKRSLKSVSSDKMPDPFGW